MLLIVLGIVFICLGIYLIISHISIKNKAVVVEGRVTGYASIEGGEYPVIHFTYNGEELDMPAAVSQKKPKYPEGEMLSVYYVQGHKWLNIVGDKNNLIQGAGMIAAGIAIIVLMIIKNFM